MHIDFWKRVRNLIFEHGLKLVDVENALDLPHSFISVGTIRGSLPSADRVLKLADYFGVSMRWLITGEDDEDSPITKYSVIASNPRILEIAYNLTLCDPEFVDIMRQFVDYELKKNRERVTPEHS